MNEWSVERECGADEWLSEWSADGMTVIASVARAPCNTRVEN